MTFLCPRCSKPYETARFLKKHLERHDNEIAAQRTTGQQGSSTDVDMKGDKDAMDESNEYEESNGDDSEIYEDQDENVATGETRRSTRLAPKDVIGIGKLSSFFFTLLHFNFFLLDRFTLF